MQQQNWLMKTEPSVYSIDDLKRDGTTLWEGVRNYQARNFMRDQMKIGDSVLIYHSNAEPNAIVGLAKVSSAALPDPSALEKKSDYFDAKASRENPIWFCVQVSFQEKFVHPILLAELRLNKSFKELLLLKKGQRLSIQPVSSSHFALLLKWAQHGGL